MGAIITLCISSYGERIKDVVLPSYNSSILYLIIHQGGSRIDELDFLNRSDVSFVSLHDLGLSRSRNAGLDRVTTKYAYIMDDDVSIDTAKVLNLVGLIEKDRADVGTCQHQYESGRYPVRYKSRSFVHNMLSIAKVSSIDICVKISAIDNCGIRFDQGFGLGTNLPSGEEYIFLADCLKKRLLVKYYPVLIGIHPDVTSGMDFFSSYDKTIAKREMFKHVFGWKAPLFIFGFWIKKALIVRRAGFFWEFTRAMLLGLR